MNRGGSWNNKPRNLRSANRNRNTPDNRNNNQGFRLAQSTQAVVAIGGHPSPEPPASGSGRVWRLGIHESASR